MIEFHRRWDRQVDGIDPQRVMLAPTVKQQAALSALLSRELNGSLQVTWFGNPKMWHVAWRLTNGTTEKTTATRFPDALHELMAPHGISVTDPMRKRR